MDESWQPKQPFRPKDFPPAEKPFPIVEVFGYDRHLSSVEARQSFAKRRCPFSESACEKFAQYGYGYCSIVYQTAWDTTPSQYAVCDHRLDGAPIRHAVSDFFTPNLVDRVLIAQEVPIVVEGIAPEPPNGSADDAAESGVRTTKYKQSIDFVALDPVTNKFIGIEAQAIDLRGGGVGPAWRAIMEGQPGDWRSYFTEEASAKGRKDTVAYGVNTANIFKRLGLQIALKGAIMSKLGSKLYVVAQKRPFDYMARRADIKWSDGDEWEICIMTFDYTGEITSKGQHEFAHAETFRTTVEDYARGLLTPAGHLDSQGFIRTVRSKLGLESS